jgi:hypothetical protein
MLRAFFLAVGIFCFLLGAECLVVDKAVLAASSDQASGGFGQHLAPAYREIVPPEWAPWSLMSGGAVVVLYSFTVPLKMKS